MSNMIWKSKTEINSGERKRTGLIRNFVVCKCEHEAVSTEKVSLSAIEVASVDTDFLWKWIYFYRFLRY